MYHYCSNEGIRIFHSTLNSSVLFKKYNVFFSVRNIKKINIISAYRIGARELNFVTISKAVRITENIIHLRIKMSEGDS